jgi:AraC family transcriptional regulator of arabinose operon
MPKAAEPTPYDPALVRRPDRVPSYIWTGLERSRWRSYRPDGIPPNWHLILTLDGQGSFRQPGRELPLRRGDLILFTPWCHQDYGAEEGKLWVNLFAHFPPRPHWLPWMRWPAVGDGLYHVRVAGDASARVRAALERCDQYAHASFSAFAHELAMSALEEAILLGANEARYGGAAQRREPGVARAVEAIAADLRRTWSVPSLARLAGLSPSRFAHLFKEVTGEPVIAYVNRLRIREAARLLEAEAMSVKEVAAAVGFNSPFYFSRQFKRWYFIDPSSFRRAAAPPLRARRR